MAKYSLQYGYPMPMKTTYLPSVDMSFTAGAQLVVVYSRADSRWLATGSTPTSPAKAGTNYDSSPKTTTALLDALKTNSLTGLLAFNPKPSDYADISMFGIGQVLKGFKFGSGTSLAKKPLTYLSLTVVIDGGARWFCVCTIGPYCLYLTFAETEPKAIAAALGTWPM